MSLPPSYETVKSAHTSNVKDTLTVYEHNPLNVKRGRARAQPHVLVNGVHIYRTRAKRTRDLQAHHDNEVLIQDPALIKYFQTVANSDKNKGVTSPRGVQCGISAIRHFLYFLNRPITATAVSDLINETLQQHKSDDFTTDDKLLAFVSQPKGKITKAQWGARVKGIFKHNRCPLQVSFNTTFTHSTKKISTGILKELYDSLPLELKTLIDLMNYAGERPECLYKRVSIDQIELMDNYAIIHIKAPQTKNRYAHICIIPRNVADNIIAICQTARRSNPFPNWDNLWRQITKIALETYGIHITSYYIRKRFHTIAQRTRMPVNQWDYLMGDKQSYGHHAGTYSLEDYSDLLEQYDRFLAPYLSITNPRDPIQEVEPQNASAELQAANKKIAELTEQIIKLTAILTSNLHTQAP